VLKRTICKINDLAKRWNLMQLDIRQTTIPGCYEIFFKPLRDDRGFLVKTFHEDVFKANGLKTHFPEEYFSYSHKGVLRGLHFQTPPKDHFKLVNCVQGEVFDAVVDLRRGSPTYAKFETFELSARKSNMIYIPPGLAHGFYIMSKDAIVMYRVTTVYSPEHDVGLLWNSANIPWPNDNPVLSERDGKSIKLIDYVSPFVFWQTY